MKNLFNKYIHKEIPKGVLNMKIIFFAFQHPKKVDTAYNNNCNGW